VNGCSGAKAVVSAPALRGHVEKKPLDATLPGMGSPENGWSAYRREFLAQLSAGGAADPFHARSRTRGTMTARFSRCLGALAPQFLHAWLGSSQNRQQHGAGALAAQLLHAPSDRRKVVSGAGAGHVSSIFWNQGRAELFSPMRLSISAATAAAHGHNMLI
jgi:hypothetical protein